MEVVNTEDYNFKLEERTLKNVNNYLNTNIYSYLETSGGQISNLYLNVGKCLSLSQSSSNFTSTGK